MIALLLLLALFGALGWAWVRSQPPAQRRRAAVMLVATGGVLVLVYLTLSGRFYLVLGLLAGLLPLARRILPGLVLGRLFRGGIPGMGSRTQPKTGNTSRVATSILEMTLDHDSGDMSGRILAGPMSGRELSELGEAEFIELLGYCRQSDEDSARLLESYLDRRFGDSWREDDPRATDEGAQTGNEDGGRSLSEQDALEILGLEQGATREDIVQAHRLMMQKMHPDRGGSTYLAALINRAKDVLMK
ncbi:molecular chaperone DnaJ [Pseudomonas sp. OIL-1]|uniref:molecular chaperone DnaJ n=1 Tax=Pseudomonas sp. OIL-1 TaxID=2706126 RepID=UPI0013A77702|nr:molecular chaperone DnaJ [Pseudomonas sp. OIL-1]QIB51976.1 molecular chaperone DnaJ [Pseudomonas sp. OIL-1]